MNVNGSGGIVVHNSILGNCHANAHGGGVYINNGNVTFNNVYVLDNYADDKGSGLYVRGSSVLNFNGGSVQDMSGHNGLYLRDTDGDPSAELEDVGFYDNVTCDVSFESGSCITLGSSYTGTCTEGACD